MTAYDDVQPGDDVHSGDPVTVDRYTASARINHWITATSLVLLALSGLSLLPPSLFFLTALFGGDDRTRAIHPWIGVGFSLVFRCFSFAFWRANLWRRVDMTWLARLRYVLAGEEDRLPEVGKYNAGRKTGVAGHVAFDCCFDRDRPGNLGPVFCSVHDNRSEALWQFLSTRPQQVTIDLHLGSFTSTRRSGSAAHSEQ